MTLQGQKHLPTFCTQENSANKRCLISVLANHWCPQLDNNVHVTNEDTEIRDHMTGRKIMRFHRKQESDHVGPLAKQLGMLPQDN